MKYLFARSDDGHETDLTNIAKPPLNPNLVPICQFLYRNSMQNHHWSPVLNLYTNRVFGRIQRKMN